MNKTATITGKRQITIPIKLFKAANLDKSRKVLVSERQGEIVITSLLSKVEKLAGSLKMPERWKGKDLEAIIEESTLEYFRDREAKRSK
ncbi:MAG: hypothetical protein A3F35_03505 [Candidatus Woykebacteria bacterium RIFCSPHIGHO2_12_FULL_45_10]|uniref:SpoVT-AbrB domain-containing protein n=1 Tax=Candidatus Woykebacteria bacterium RIFCSPHIGHO2_12_FULL_45_10 TaxID=1802603 RepID=A0A1G1WRT3_9BACT|nr:MAG: hypothetical protein A3F35_03505 [Candidatus Woykebacteria bacterium RIFCSPHIGHO2_12_FULL_45_10]